MRKDLPEHFGVHRDLKFESGKAREISLVPKPRPEKFANIAF